MPQHELTPIPPGKLASVVTFLEMRELAKPDPAALERDDLELRRVSRPTPAWYRELFLAVGREWLWFSRLRLDDTALTAIIHDPAVEIYALYRAGEDAPKGMLELDFRKAPDLELAFLGVTADMVGQGGRTLPARIGPAPSEGDWTCALLASYLQSRQPPRAAALPQGGVRALRAGGGDRGRSAP